MSGQALALDDLGYELRLLLGADEIVRFIEAHDKATASDADRFGNLVNYFKDSAYLHARNLLNALTNGCETEMGTVPAGIKSELYGKIKGSLEVYVTHVKKPRDQRGVSNIRNGQHLNERTHDLSAEARRCWSEWIDATGHQELTDILDAADKAAHADTARLKELTK